MRHWWWKILAVLLLLSASIAALRTPLAPGLVNVSELSISPGPVEMDVTGYNTSFTSGDGVLIENGGQYLCATEVTVIDAEHLRARFDIPAGMHDTSSYVIADGLAYDIALYTDSLGSGIATGACAPPAVPGKAFFFPNLNRLDESVRNLHFHVPMWFAMIVLMGISVVRSILALSTNSLHHDRAALSAVHIGLVFCTLGLITGALWARSTWGAFWTNDVKLNGAAVTALIYLAYLVLRGSITDAYKRARLAGIYNIFAFVLLVVFLFVVPRLNAVDSMHPGNGGNSGFSNLDMDNRLRAVFYPAVLGWILLGVWMCELRDRAARLTEHIER